VTHAACPDDYHCGRPENSEPFVIPGTPIELYSSEMDAGRWRHWGGADQWLCREHPYYLGESYAEATPDRYRTMEVFEAAEHATLHRHGLVEEARDLERPLEESSLSEFVAVNAQRLDALDRLAPDGGHAGRSESPTKPGS
jgi:hypothetical protein